MEKLKENREAFPNTKKAGMYRTYFRKGKVIIEFGQEFAGGVNVISSVWLNPSSLAQFIVCCIDAGVEYQKKYGEDIGFSELIKAMKAKKESEEQV